jgi:hypothetical protein
MYLIILCISQPVAKSRHTDIVHSKILFYFLFKISLFKRH